MATPTISSHRQTAVSQPIAQVRRKSGMASTLLALDEVRCTMGQINWIGKEHRRPIDGAQLVLSVTLRHSAVGQVCEQREFKFQRLAPEHSRTRPTTA